MECIRSMKFPSRSSRLRPRLWLLRATSCRQAKESFEEGLRLPSLSCYCSAARRRGRRRVPFVRSGPALSRKGR